MLVVAGLRRHQRDRRRSARRGRSRPGRDPAAQVERQRVVQVALRRPAPAGRLRRAQATAAGSTSAAYTSRPGTAARSAAAEGAGAAAQVDDDVAGRQPGRRGPDQRRRPLARDEDAGCDGDPQPAELGAPDAPAPAARPRPGGRSAAARSASSVAASVSSRPRPRRTRTRRRGGSATSSGRTGMVDDAPMPSVSTQITFIVVGYAVLWWSSRSSWRCGAASGRAGSTRWCGCSRCCWWSARWPASAPLSGDGPDSISTYVGYLIASVCVLPIAMKSIEDDRGGLVLRPSSRSPRSRSP